MSKNDDDGGGIILVGLALIGAAIIFARQKKKVDVVEQDIQFVFDEKKPAGYSLPLKERPVFDPNAVKCDWCGDREATGKCMCCGRNLCDFCTYSPGYCGTCDDD